MSADSLNDLARAELGPAVTSRALDSAGPEMDGFRRPPVDRELEAEIDGLHRRLQSQAVIEQAKGLLIGYYGIAPDRAFEVLRRWSQCANVKVRVLAADLVAAAGQPHDRRYGALAAALASEIDRRGPDAVG